MSIELKIKSKHLALEPAIIRKEEFKISKQISYLKKIHQINDEFSDIIWPLRCKYASLHNHRKFDVRNEARATYLARAYLKGLPYNVVEKTKDLQKLRNLILPRVTSMVVKYGDNRKMTTEMISNEIIKWLGLV